MSYRSYDAYRLVAKSTPKEYYRQYQEAFLNESFDDASTFDTIPVDGIDTDVRIVDIKVSQQGNQIISFAKELLFRPNTVRRRGSYAEIDGKQWMLFDFRPGVVPKALIRLCNSTLRLKTSESHIIIGYDAMGRPVYETIPTFTEWPCIVESKVQNPYDNLNAVVNLPEGVINITIPYTELVKDDMNFTMWGYTFKTIGNSYVHVVGGEGPMTITAQRVV